MPWNDVHSSILRSRAFGLVYICGLWKPAACLGTCTLFIHVIGGLLWRTSTCPIKSYQVQSLKSSILKTLEHSQEFLCLSIDATLKVCMTVQGQANYRASAQTRNAACFDDEHSLRRVLTIRGRTGAVLGMVPVPSEESPKIKESLRNLFCNQALFQVRYLATDNPSPKLFRELKEICPNLSCLWAASPWILFIWPLSTNMPSGGRRRLDRKFYVVCYIRWTR